MSDDNGDQPMDMLKEVRKRRKGEVPSGIAALTPEQRSTFSRQGGEAAHAKGTAHEYDSLEAAAAGKLGGASIVAKYGREYMREIGRRGAQKRNANRQAARQEEIEQDG